MKFLNKKTKYKRIIHIALFFLIIPLLIGLYHYWNIEKINREKLSEAVYELNKPNKVLELINKATSFYFEAENHFNRYLQKYEPNELENYKKSLRKLSNTFDSLSEITDAETDYVKIIDSKKNSGIEMAKIKKHLDSLINTGLTKVEPINYDFIKQKHSFNKYNSENIINSITYDTIYSKIEAPEKKGLFGRLGNALAGKEELAKQTVEIKITMKVGNSNKTGSFLDQLNRFSEEINNFYKHSFTKNYNLFQEQLKNTYNKLQNKDKEIININEDILKNSKYIINFYYSTAYNLNTLKQQKLINRYNTEINNQNILIQRIIISLFLITFILLIYTLIANTYEIQLEKAKRKAEKNDHIKTRILGMLSHEMRAPLNIISNQSSEIKNNINILNSNINQNIDSILFNSNLLNLTFNQILDLIKNENSKLSFYNENICLSNEIKSIIQSLKVLADTKKINLIDNIDISTNQLVFADSVKIHQLFYNLIGNSLKFTEKGSITVNAKLENFKDKLKFNVSIKDTGLGISEKEIPKIFNKYFQSKNNINHVLGAGLGLNLCKEIIELYEGKISIESQINKGTNLIFYMFFNKPKDINQSIKTKLIKFNTKNDFNIAIVDDDTFITEITKKNLKDLNFNVYDFNSSSKMLEFLNQNNKIDLILTDIQLPEISGIELINIIKNKYKNIPIIAITGDHTFNQNKVIEYNINEYIIKPINKEELYTKINNIIINK